MSLFFLSLLFIVNYIQQVTSPLPIAMVQLANRSPYPQQSFKIYRRLPNPVPSYPNNAIVQIYDQTNYNQQQPSSMIVQNPNQQQITLQLKRERQRRTMIDKIILLFDENGDGQLTKDELYSMALRSNMFPKFHHYLKQTPT